jgi:hypothetical protein
VGGSRYKVLGVGTCQVTSVQTHDRGRSEGDIDPDISGAIKHCYQDHRTMTMTKPRTMTHAGMGMCSAETLVPQPEDAVAIVIARHRSAVMRESRMNDGC